MDRNYYNLEVVYDCAVGRFHDCTLSRVSRRLRTIASLMDVCASIDFFSQELDNMKRKYNLHIDEDFDFDKFLPTNPSNIVKDIFPILEEMRSIGFQDNARDVHTIASKYFPTLSDDEIAKHQYTDQKKYEEETRRKKIIEDFRKALVNIDKGENVSDYELETALQKAIYELFNIIIAIKKEIHSNNNSKEKGEGLYQELKNRYIPDGFIGTWKSQKDYKKWVDNSYEDEISPELRRDFVAKKLIEVLESFIQDDPEHQLPSNKKKYEKEFHGTFDEHKDPNMMKYHYATLRQFMRYDNGLLFVSDASKLGKYIFMNRKGLCAEKIEMLFDFIGLNLVVAEEEKKNVGKINIIPNKKKNSIFSSFVTEPIKADSIIKKLHELVRGKEKPKERMKPLRAALDAGVINKPSWDAFKIEFGDNFVSSKSSFDSYLKVDSKPYFGADFEKLIAIFKEL